MGGRLVQCLRGELSKIAHRPVQLEGAGRAVMQAHNRSELFSYGS